MPVIGVRGGYPAEFACGLLNATGSTIWSLSEDSLVTQAAGGRPVPGESVPLHGSLAGQAILTRAPVATTGFPAPGSAHSAKPAVPAAP